MTAGPPQLVDTDVLIWHLRGYGQATRRLDQLDVLTLSSVSYLEVLQGIRDKAELAAVKKMLERREAGADRRSVFDLSRARRALGPEAGAKAERR